MILQILKIIVAIGTIATGLISLIRPRSVTGFTGLVPKGPRGITEIRAVLGAFFVALGTVPLISTTRQPIKCLASRTSS
jgi:hypothetical protein